MKILLFLLQVSVDGFSCDLMRLKAASTLAIIAKVNTEIYFGTYTFIVWNIAMHFHKQAFPFSWIIISEIICLNLLAFVATSFWKTNPIAGKSDTD